MSTTLLPSPVAVPDDFIRTAGLAVHPALHRTMEDAARAAGLPAGAVWQTLATLVRDHTTANEDLLAERDRLQTAIDEWCADNDPRDVAAQTEFLRDIGYLVSEGESTGTDCTIDPGFVDPEIARVCGPQLVVPVTNARFVLNAANARWGSLYDALYGSDVIDENDGREKSGTFNPVRGDAVVAYVADFLDRAVPLDGASHRRATGYRVVEDSTTRTLEVCLRGESASDVSARLVDPHAFAGHTGPADAPVSILLRHHGLHMELVFSRDADHPVASRHAAHLADVRMESALTTILDLEDSVAVVDGEDKALAYNNLLGLFTGELAATFTKNGHAHTRTLAEDRKYTAADGGSLSLPGRSLLLLRTVGHLMRFPDVLALEGEDADNADAGTPIFETFLDTLMAGVLTALDSGRRGRFTNSVARAGYIVRPKMHGPEEVAFAADLLATVEAGLGLPAHCLKVGIMDEERRTSANLRACIAAAKSRVIFINTGFLDRTGDEIHTWMHAAPVVRKEAMKSEPWLGAYEDRNVDAGLACGFRTRAQVGKGMWPKPDRMAEMMTTKQAHPEAGANCAWVPSPTAAILHAMHYHHVDVPALQAQMQTTLEAHGMRRPLADLLTPPLANGDFSDADIDEELALNAQSMLGYVVRWVHMGIGCSKVPDLSDVGLMEDRATLRISCQLLANWLTHGVVDEARVRAAFVRMARKVDAQNEGQSGYLPMGPDYETSPAFIAALELVTKGAAQPSGYTEPILHRARLALKRGAK